MQANLIGPSLLISLLLTSEMLAEEPDRSSSGSFQPVLLQASTVARPATRAEAIAVLTRRDEFIEALGPFDRQARLRTGEPVSESQFLRFLEKQALEWEPQEWEAIAPVVSSIATRLERYDLPLPETVLFVKTSGEEESQASYSRGNAIILPRRLVRNGSASLERTLVHELFHLMMRYHPATRDAMYALLGFKPCAAVQLPEGLSNRRVTIPDAPVNRYYIQLKIDGRLANVAPVLVAASSKYDPRQGGTLPRYIEFRLMPVDPASGRLAQYQTPKRGQLIHPVHAPDYWEKVGRNTACWTLPEEILADDFTRLVMGTKRLNRPQLAQGLASYFAKGSVPMLATGR